MASEKEPGCRSVDANDAELVGTPEPPRCRVTIELEIVGSPVAARACVEALLTAGPLQRLIDSQRGLLVTSAVVSQVEEL